MGLVAAFQTHHKPVGEKLLKRNAGFAQFAALLAAAVLLVVLSGCKSQVSGDVMATVADVATPIDPDEYPADSTCNAFDRHQVLRSW